MNPHRAHPIITMWAGPLSELPSAVMVVSLPIPVAQPPNPTRDPTGFCLTSATLLVDTIVIAGGSIRGEGSARGRNDGAVVECSGSIREDRYAEESGQPYKELGGSKGIKRAVAWVQPKEKVFERVQELGVMGVKLVSVV